MPSPAVPARTAHSRPFFMSQIHAPRSAAAKQPTSSGRALPLQHHAHRLMHIGPHAVYCLAQSPFPPQVHLVCFTACRFNAWLPLKHEDGPHCSTVARGSWKTSLDALCVHLTCSSRSVSSFHVCVAPRLCASMWECGQPSSSSRRPYVARSHLARSAPLFASAAQQHAPPPRGPTLSELASR